MKHFVRHGVTIAAMMSALSGAPAHAASSPRSVHSFGEVAADSSFERVIKITPDTASVSIYRMETVKFVDQQTGKSFVWRFNTPRTENFSLSEIAPAEFLGGQRVTAYVWDIPVPGAMLILYLLLGSSSHA
jgi:hypothetical protein